MVARNQTLQRGHLANHRKRTHAPQSQESPNPTWCLRFPSEELEALGCRTSESSIISLLSICQVGLLEGSQEHPERAPDKLVHVMGVGVELRMDLEDWVGGGHKGAPAREIANTLRLECDLGAAIFVHPNWCNLGSSKIMRVGDMLQACTRTPEVMQRG